MTAGTLGHGVPVLPTVSRPFGPLREVSVPLCGPECRAPVPSVGHAEGARATVARDDCLADGGWQKTRTGTWLGDQPAARATNRNRVSLPLSPDDSGSGAGELANGAIRRLRLRQRVGPAWLLAACAGQGYWKRLAVTGVTWTIPHVKCWVVPPYGVI